MHRAIERIADAPVTISIVWSEARFSTFRINGAELLGNKVERIVLDTEPSTDRGTDYSASNEKARNDRHRGLPQRPPNPNTVGGGQDFMLAALTDEVRQIEDLIGLLANGGEHHLPGLAARVRMMVHGGSGRKYGLLQHCAAHGSPDLPARWPLGRVEGLLAVTGPGALQGALRPSPGNLDEVAKARNPAVFAVALFPASSLSPRIAIMRATTETDMASKKKIHPLDAADREAVAKAVSFNCHLRLSPSAKINEPAATLTEAAAIVDKIRAAHPGRSVLVYAIMPNGHIPAAVPVPQDMIVAARAPDFTEGEVPSDGAPVQEQVEAEKPVQRRRAPSRRAAVQEAAERGELPAPPDFTAPTHARWRGRLAELVEMVNAGDVDGLRAASIPTYSTSPRAMARYRDLAVIALEARTKKAAA